MIVVPKYGILFFAKPIFTGFYEVRHSVFSLEREYYIRSEIILSSNDNIESKIKIFKKELIHS